MKQYKETHDYLVLLYISRFTLYKIYLKTYQKWDDRLISGHIVMMLTGAGRSDVV